MCVPAAGGGCGLSIDGVRAPFRSRHMFEKGRTACPTSGASAVRIPIGGAWFFGGILLKFRQKNPTWNVEVLSCRLNYVTERMATLSQPAVALPAETTAPNQLKVKPQPKLAAALTAAQVKLLEAGAEPRI